MASVGSSSDVDLSSSDDEEFTVVGGYEYEFVDQVLDNQMCNVCLLPMRDPAQTRKCGHRFCTDCLRRSLRTNNRLCPTCRTRIPIRDELFHDVAWSRDIMSLHVKCPMNARGCEWTGEVRHAEPHKRECSFEDVPCFKCDSVFERQHEKIHCEEECQYRVVKCVFCKDWLPYYLKSVHEDNVCQEFPLVCKNKCGLTKIPRVEMEVHLRDHCTMTEVGCPYKDAGCVFMGKRANVGRHIETSVEVHMQLLLTSLSDAKQQLSKLPALEKQVMKLKKQKLKRLTTRIQRLERK